MSGRAGYEPRCERAHETDEWYEHAEILLHIFVMSSSDHIGARELEEIGDRWRQLSRDRGAEHAALGLEFNLYLLRNPEARERVAAKRSEVVDQLARYIVDGIESLGATLLIPATTFAHIIIATTDAVELGSHLDEADLYQPMVEMYVSAVKMP
jgi:hypothetical protein